ncbi:MAG: helix-turn-helix domain-containing protein [Alphaproteobacteria bacterium]|nr:helix-turn-helix domain-containing protein [Alphaproteobacteria bacterium]
MPQKHLVEIRDNPLFASIGAESFAALTRGAYVQNFPPHTELITEGEAADFLHIVSTGCVELFSIWQGRETSMSFQTENSTFILAATIKDLPYLMSARTITKSRVIMIPSQDIRGVFERDSMFAKSIVSELATCYRNAIKTAKNIKLRTSLERLANYILKLHLAQGGRIELELAVEKRRIASFLGMTPENLSRSFAGLKSHGVEMDGQVIKVVDAAKLEEFAHPNALIDG